jgi:quercetin dioxygenase-like cupin family protein
MPEATHRRTALTIVAALVLVPASLFSCSAGMSSIANSAGEASMYEADRASLPAINWGPAPAVFQPGAQMAVIQGDPGKSEPFIVRLRFPNGYAIAPHTHPTDEHITVIGGAFKVGMGTAFDESTMATLPTGGFVTAPALHAHYAKAQGVTTVQVNAVGPFILTYVNPSDLPRPASR